MADFFGNKDVLSFFGIVVAGLLAIWAKRTPEGKDRAEAMAGQVNTLVDSVIEQGRQLKEQGEEIRRLNNEVNRLGYSLAAAANHILKLEGHIDRGGLPPVERPAAVEKLFNE